MYYINNSRLLALIVVLILHSQVISQTAIGSFDVKGNDDDKTVIGAFDVKGYVDEEKEVAQEREAVFTEDLFLLFQRAVELNETKDYIHAFEYLHNAQTKADSIMDAEALTIASMAGVDFDYYFNILNGEAQCSYSLGLTTQLKTYNDKMEEWYEARANSASNTLLMFSYRMMKYKSIADYYYLQEEYSDAERNYNSALFNTRSSYEDACIHHEMSQMYYAAKNYDKALEKINEVVDYYNHPTEDSQDILMYYQAVADRAMCMARQGDYDTALAEIENAISYFTTSDDFYHELLRRKAKILMLRLDYSSNKQNDIKEAKKIYTDHFAWIRNEVNDKFVWFTESQREDYWTGLSKFVKDSYCLENNAPDLLYDVTLYRKSLLFNLGTGFEDMLTDAERKSLDSCRVRNMLKSTDVSLEMLPSSVYERQLMSTVRKDGRLDRFLSQSKGSWKVIQKALPSNSCALEFVQYERGIYQYMGVLVIKKNFKQPLFIPLFDVDKLLNSYVEGYKTVRTVLKNPDNTLSVRNTLLNSSTIAKQVWNQSLRQALSDADKVYFCPDAFLHELPIEYMLPEDIADKKFYRLSSTQLLAEKDKWIDNDKLHHGAALVCGYIDYESSTADLGVSTKLLLGNDRLCFEKFKDVTSLSRYSYHLDQCKEILNYRNNSQDKFLTDNEASEYNFQREITHYPIVHIATHGGFEGYESLSSDISSSASSSSLSYSALMLAGCTNNTNNSFFIPRYKDGFLSARELSKMHMQNVELFTTSACQTNRGYVTSEGIYGVVRGLKAGGVKSMVTSLWNVTSAVAAKLMPLLYKHIAEGDSLYDAFYKARKEISEETVGNDKIGENLNYLDVFVLIDAL